MISLLNGTVRSLLSDRVIIEVQGVGYAVLVTSATSASLTLGAQAIVHTSLVVREDSLTLFGFLDEESKNTFELLQTVSGLLRTVVDCCGLLREFWDSHTITGSMSSSNIVKARQKNKHKRNNRLVAPLRHFVSLGARRVVNIQEVQQ